MTSRDPKMEYVAWTGIVTMHNAAWGDEAGSTVTFKLPMRTITQGDLSETRNPFSKYTKRRKGKAGTRFYMAVSTSEAAPKTIYRDEAMLAGWNDSQQHGHTVKFWLCNDAMGHPFEGVSRTQELALALSELDDDNQPVDQKMRDRVEKQQTHPATRVSYAAAMLCQNPDFWEWAQQQDDMVLVSSPITKEEEAKQWMYQALGISSRAELDVDRELATRFERKIRQPFIESLGIC